MIALISGIVMFISIACILLICYRKTKRDRYYSEDLTLFEQALLVISIIIGTTSLALLIFSIGKYV